MSWADTQKGIRLSMADLFCRIPGLRYCSGHLGRSSVPLASSNASSPPRRCFRQTKIAQRRYFAATLSFLFQVYYDSLIPHSCLEANIRGVPLQEGNKTVGSQVLLELLRSSAVKRTGNSAFRLPFGSFRRP